MSNAVYSPVCSHSWELEVGFPKEWDLKLENNQSQEKMLTQALYVDVQGKCLTVYSVGEIVRDIRRNQRAVTVRSSCCSRRAFVILVLFLYRYNKQRRAEGRRNHGVE